MKGEDDNAVTAASDSDSEPATKTRHSRIIHIPKQYD